MHRARRLDAIAQTLNAQLFAGERILQDQDGVGLYDGQVLSKLEVSTRALSNGHRKDKDPAHDNGRLYVTTHRLIYLDAARPHYSSCDFDLFLVRQTEYWAGFLKSSPKITLLLGEPLSSLAPSTGTSTVNGNELPGHQEEQAQHVSAQSWVCRVCGFSNSPSPKCGLCGVPRNKALLSTPISKSATPSPIAPEAVPAKRDDGLLPCPTCTFLNHPSMTRCEMCESPLTSATTPSMTPTSRPSTPANVFAPGEGPMTPAPGASFIRLSFRKGGERVFYAALKKALQTKAWEYEMPRALVKGKGREDDTIDLSHRLATIGIDGILKTIDLDAREREGELQDALQDLKALMAKAKEMVQMAQGLNSRLSAGDTDASATLVRSSLVSLGLPSPVVTPDMAAGERAYHVSLAQELAGVLSRSRLVVERGLVSLDEVWCHWNRARGVALVSPRDLRLACAHLPAHSAPDHLTMRTFRSGLCVLQTPRYTDDAFSARVLPTLDRTTLEIARAEGLSATLALEMMELLETERGEVVRDEGGVLRWWPNLLLDFVWSDPNPP